MSDLKYNYNFDPAEQNNTAATIASFVLQGGLEVLDVGSGPAWVSRYLAAEHARQVTCLDNDTSALASLEGTGLRAFESDLEAPDWDAAIQGEQFDVVLIADVLEHLREPGRLLDDLVRNGYLRADGRVVISVPNASHAGVVSELLLGDFRYTETGILDETHVRWFTLESLTRLLEGAGLVVERVARTTRTLEQTPTGERAAQIPAEVRRTMRELNPESETYQFVVVARPDNAAARVQAERQRFEADRRSWWLEREQVVAEQKRSAAEVTRLRELLRQERERFHQALADGAEELSTKQQRIQALRGRVQKLRKRTAQLQREIDGLKTSRYFIARQRAARTARRLGLRK